MSASRDRLLDFLYREARLLDDRQWDEWLECYSPKVEYWMPAWDDHDTLKVQPWNGQVNEPLLPCLRRQSIAPRWAQALTRPCSVPCLSRVMTTGWRPIQVVK
jgi:hypothetical protein